MPFPGNTCLSLNLMFCLQAKLIRQNECSLYGSAVPVAIGLERHSGKLACACVPSCCRRRCVSSACWVRSSAMLSSQECCWDCVASSRPAAQTPGLYHAEPRHTSSILLACQIQEDPALASVHTGVGMQRAFQGCLLSAQDAGLALSSIIEEASHHTAPQEPSISHEPRLHAKQVSRHASP